MRIADILLQGATLAGAASASTSASGDAYLWTVDTDALKASANQVASTSSYDAERILARRKGIDESHFLPITDESLLADLNELGGYQIPLLGTGSQIHPAKLFIRISDYNGRVDDFNTLPALWIEEPETNLLDTFESRFDINNVCEYHIKSQKSKHISIKYTYIESSKPCLPQSEIETLPTLLVIQSMVPTPNEVGGKGISHFHRTLTHLAAADNVETTLLVLPEHSKLKKSKAKPMKKTELRKRAESPLDLPVSAFPSGIASPLASNKSSNTTHPLPKIIPQYFASLDTCVNVTNSCSGHGSCLQAHGTNYKCVCNRTVVRQYSDGSSKTVQWGGNACEKKDISVEFILFASFGVFFTAVVFGGIGMLYSMGSQELPSVIGAGVVGPRAQR